MPGKTTRILLVDDERPVQKLLSYPLEKEGYEVTYREFDGGHAVPLPLAREALARL